MRLCFHQTINYNSRFWFCKWFLFLFSFIFNQKPIKIIAWFDLEGGYSLGKLKILYYFYVVHSCLTAHNSLNGYAISMQIFRRFRKLSDIMILYYFLYRNNISLQVHLLLLLPVACHIIWRVFHCFHCSWNDILFYSMWPIYDLYICMLQLQT